MKTELTPKGECFKNYLEKLENGSKDYIQVYEDYITEIQLLLKEKHHVDLNRKETIELASSYFSEYF